MPKFCYICSLLWPHDIFITPGFTHFTWNEHLMYARTDGKQLREGFTSRFASNMIVMALLLNVELAVLFSPSEVGDTIREEMRNNNRSKATAVGILIIVSIFCAILCILATFLAWTSLSSVSNENVHLVCRSTVGRYMLQLPKTLLCLSLYSFLAWLWMTLFLILPDRWAGPILLVVVLVFLYTVSLASAFERMVMDSGAMGEKKILETRDVDKFAPAELDDVLLTRAKERRRNKQRVRQYYAAMYEHKDESGGDDLAIGISTKIET